MAKHEIKKLPKSEVEISASVAWDEWKDLIGKAASELSKNLKIPGFRPGKAPLNMVEEKIGKLNILEQAAERAIQKAYAQIVAEEKLEVIGQPKAEITKLAEGNDLEFKARVAVVPVVSLKPWKEAIKAVNKKFQEEKVEIKDEELEKELEKIAESRAKLITVNREAKKGDTVFVDFEVLRDGVVIENGTGKNHPLVIGKGVFIPGFEDNIEGMKEQEEKEFELKFPDEYHEKNLAGKPATFKTKVNLVQERQLPEMNDEFAKSLGSFENLEALKKSIRDGMSQEQKEKKKEKRRTEFLEKLIGLSEIDVPEILVHEELHKMIHEFEDQFRMMGMSFDGYLEKIKKTQKDLEHDWEPQAAKRVKSALILEWLAKDQEVSVSSDKIEEEMNKTLQYYKNTKDMEKNIDLERLYNYVKGMMTNEEVFKFLENI